MKMKNVKMRQIDESSFGVYAWKLPSGAFLADTEGNILNVPSEKYDIQKQKILKDAAAHYGYPVGEAVFLSGARRVREEEYQEQIDRMKSGLTPDVYDAGALMDELAAKEQHGTE